mmetsp:Transcript_44277/g.117401  ORF Transcript_44277/g.117401 Transcript_44277/m.117401 type:complete len:267 (+) Transcript_44277:417-1217(+)
MDRWFPAACRLHDVLNGDAPLNKNTSRSEVGPCALRWNFVQDHLYHTHTHAEYVASWEPLASVQSLWRHVPWSSTRKTGVVCHGLRHTEINDNHLWLKVVWFLDHQVRFLDVAMHHGLSVHELQTFETLLEEAFVVVFRHLNALSGGSFLQCREVTTQIRLSDHVDKLVVLEKFRDLRNLLTSQELHRLELFNEILDARRTHLIPPHTLHAELSFRGIDHELHLPLPTLTQHPHLLERISDRFERNVDNTVGQRRPFPMGDELELG